MAVACGGANLGAAQGSITINTTQAQQAPAVMRQVAAGINSAMAGVNTSTNKAASSFGALAGSVRGLAGAFGLSLGVGAIAQLARAAVSAEALATAYDRQGIAAANLAGSQTRLNSLLQVYQKATGGIVSDSAALSNVTKLMAVGFADDAQELEKFAAAIRGISIAMGTTQDYTTQNLILELFTQRGMRLDQLGLQYDKVRVRADELAAADSNLTDKIAYQNAVLEQAIERYGGLTKSGVGAATGMEKAAKAWADLNLKIGQTAQGPLDIAGKAFANFFAFLSYQLDTEIAKLDFFIKQWQRLQNILGNSTYSPDYAGGSGVSDRARGNANRGGVGVPSIIEGEAEAKLDWARGVSNLNKRLYDDIISAESDYGRQRADTIRSYQKGVAREERDFNRNRLRAELEQLDAVADVWKEAARREAKASEELARSLGDASRESDKRIAESREESNQRLAELDEDYNKDREKAAAKHAIDLMDAAGRLDAQQVYELQRNFAEQEKEAKDAHDEQRKELQEQLAERVKDEEAALADSNQRAREAYDRQLSEARANDALRIEEMKADFEERKAQEDADRALRAQDRAQDHVDQLAQMDTAHGERIAQLHRHAAAERAQLDTEAQEALLALGVRNVAWQNALDAKEKWLEGLWDKYMNHVGGSLMGPQAQNSMITPGGFPRLTTPSVAPVTAQGWTQSQGRSAISGNTFNIYQQPNQSQQALVDQIATLLEEMEQ